MPEQTGYTIGWGTLALINAGLAQGKGRPGGWWFLISLLLGPIATLMIVLLLPQQTVEPPVTGGRWRPRPFTRLDWIVAGIIVAALVLTAVVLVLRI